MPPFRIHQTRIRPERILIRLTQGKYVLASQIPLIVPSVEPSPSSDVVQPVVEKKKNIISLKQIKQIIGLLQKSSHKNLSKMLTPELNELLSIDDTDVDKVEDTDEEVESESELDLDDDEDLLIIDV